MKKIEKVGKASRAKGQKKISFWERIDNKMLFLLTLIVRHAIVVLGMPGDFGGRLKTCKIILEALYGNLWFPTPPVSDVELTAAITKYENAAANVKSGGLEAETLFLEAWDELNTLIKRLKGYVQDVCWANPAKAEEIAQAAGMDIRAYTAKGKQDFSVKPKGSALLLMGKIKSKCAGHEWGVTEDPADAMGWYKILIESTGRSKTLVYGLTPGKLYYFRHRCIMPAGCAEWDNIISCRVPDMP